MTKSSLLSTWATHLFVKEEEEKYTRKQSLTKDYACKILQKNKKLSRKVYNSSSRNNEQLQNNNNYVEKIFPKSFNNYFLESREKCEYFIFSKKVLSTNKIYCCISLRVDARHLASVLNFSLPAKIIKITSFLVAFVCLIL